MTDTSLSSECGMAAFKIPAGFRDAEDYLRFLAGEGLARRGLDNDDETVKKRMMREIKEIGDRGHVNYYLMLRDLLSKLRGEGAVTGPGRGGAPSSLLSYVLGITDINPLEHGLLFERFVGGLSGDVPRIEIDLDGKGLMGVRRYLQMKYADCAIPFRESDFLHLSVLDTIGKAAEGIPLPREYDDPAVFSLFSEGDTGDVFMFGSEGCRKWLRELKPETFDELAALYVLYSPNHMERIPEYVSARRNGEFLPGLAIYPELRDILGETSGILLYQEQVMRTGWRYGLTADESSRLFRKRTPEALKEAECFREKFIGGVKAFGHSYGDAESLWEAVLAAGSRAFPKSHAVSYTALAYQTAWLKVYHRKSFEASLKSREQSGDSVSSFRGCVQID